MMIGVGGKSRARQVLTREVNNDGWLCKHTTHKEGGFFFFDGTWGESKKDWEHVTCFLVSLLFIFVAREKRETRVFV